MGKPVALDASAELRDTRGFISMITMRPLAGLKANWTWLPPVSTPISRRPRRAASRRGSGDGIAGMHGHGVEILDGADYDAVVRKCAHHLQLVFLPAERAL